MKRLNIKNKETHLLVLFGLLGLLFVSVNLANNYSPQGNYIFDDELPRSAAISINIVSPTANDNFSSTPPDFIVEIDDAVNPINTMWYTIDGGATNITFTVNGTIDQTEWTALADGPVTLTFYANNSISDIDSASRSINKDTVAPVVTITSPITDEYFGATAPSFIVVISDSANPIDTRWYTIDGGATNITFTVNGTIDQTEWTAHSDGSVTLTFYANDTLGNIGVNSVGVNKDTGLPTVSITSPTGGEYFDATAPDYVVEVSDSGSPINTMWYTIDGGAINITFTVNGTIDQNNWTAHADGSVTITFYANDTAGNINSDTVIVNKDTGLPTVSITTPTEGEYFDATAPGFTVEIVDDNLDTMWYTIDGGATNITFTVNGTIDQTEWTAHSDGSVTIIFYANDTAGNMASDSVGVNKDTGLPIITITSPTGGVYFDATAPDYIVEISSSGSPIDTMWYTIDGGATNITFTVNGTIDQNNWTAHIDGAVTLIFYANDSVGNLASNMVLINKDTVVPTIVINLPANNTVIGTLPSMNITVTEVNIYRIWYSVDSNVMTLDNNSDQDLNLLIWNALPEGPFTIEFFANDTAGNLNSFYSVDLTKDIAAPIVTIVHPLANATYTNAPQITLTINDATLDTTWYTIVGTNYTFEFTAVLGTNIVNINQAAWNALSNGPVTIIFYANDSLGRISSDSITLDRNVPEPFDFIAFLFGPVGLTIMGAAVAIVVIVILLKRRKTHKTSDKEVRKIESLWD